MTVERFLGCLVGGAVGDALGAPVEFLSWDDIRHRFGSAGLTDYYPAYGKLGAVTDDTQMTLFTAEGLIRAENRLRAKGITSTDVVYFAYLRWLATQGYRPTSEHEDLWRSGWLLNVPELWSQRGPGNTCLSALASGQRGSMAAPINQSKGCGGIMRIAPAGLAFEDPFLPACEMAAFTHGHPSGYLAAGFYAALIASVLKGMDIAPSVAEARRKLLTYQGHEECLRAVDRALDMASSFPANPETVERVGAVWVAEEALAVAIFCALRAETFAHGVLLAVNHSGDSDSTGALTGALLGAMHGMETIPDSWVDRLELRDEIIALAGDLFRHYREESDDLDDWDRYPGW